MVRLDLEGEFKLFNVIKSDPLKFVYNVTIGLIQFKMIRIASILTLVIHSLISLLFAIELVLTFDARLLISYGPIIFLFSSGFVGIVVILHIEYKLKVLLGQTIGSLWEFDVTSALFKTMTKESRKILAAVHFNNLTMLLIVFFDLPLSGHNSDIFYAKYFFERFLPTYSTYMCWVYFSTLPVLKYMTLINPTILLYIVTQLKFQVYYLNELLVNIGAEYKDIDDFSLQCDEKYQQEVTFQLKRCIKRHWILKYMEKKINEIVYMPLNILMGLGIAAFISLFFGIIVERQEMYIIRIIFTLILVCVNSSFSVVSGQFLTNESLKTLTSAANCRWTSWNYSNRKSLMIFMSFAQKPFVIGTPFVRCEFPFVITAGNFIGSVCAFFFQLAKMKQEEMANN